MLLEARGLTRRFAGVTAVNGIDLVIDAGETVALLGPNGAGKSTLLRLCATSLRPSAGILKLFGEEAHDSRLKARRQIGFLSHQSFLYPDLTITENLLFYAQMYRTAAAAVRVAELVEQVGLRGWANRPVRTLSKGLEQRCALARALLHAPSLLLLDEPFTGLDAQATEMLSRTLGRERARGTTVLMATHDLDRAATLCGRAVVLQQGRVSADLPLGAELGTPLPEAYAAALRKHASRGAG